MDIKPYADLIKPYYHIENIEIHYPEDRPGEKSTLRENFNSQKEARSSITLEKIIATSPKNTTGQTTHGC